MNGSQEGEPVGGKAGRKREDWERLELAARGIRLRWGSNQMIERLQYLTPCTQTPEHHLLSREVA